MRVFATSRAILANSKGEILLVHRSASESAHPGRWDIPGGQVEAGEDLRAAAIRETQEEVGVQLHDPQLVFAISALRAEGTGSWLFFVARVPDDIELSLSTEHDSYKWVPFGDLPNYTEYEILLAMHTFVTEHKLLEFVA